MERLLQLPAMLCQAIGPHKVRRNPVEKFPRDHLLYGPYVHKRPLVAQVRAVRNDTVVKGLGVAHGELAKLRSHPVGRLVVQQLAEEQVHVIRPPDRILHLMLKLRLPG